MDNAEFFKLINELNTREKEKEYDMTTDCNIRDCPYFREVDYKNCSVNRQDNCGIKRRGKL